MANPEHVAILERGVKEWNDWREKNPGLRPDLVDSDLHRQNLSGGNFSSVNFWDADLSQANLAKTDFRHADLGNSNCRNADFTLSNLSEAKLHRASFYMADLEGAELGRANLIDANFAWANLRSANLGESNLQGANLVWADLSNANLRQTNLLYANLVGATLTNADLRDSRVYGISAWDVTLDQTVQSNLIITRSDDPTITVDNLEVAQFIYLLLSNKKIRDVIDTVARKAVLILGRFGRPDRKAVLDDMRDELRKRNYLPIMFDFERPTTRNNTETVRTLAHLSRFIIADITDPSSIPLELQAIIPDLKVPVQPVLLSGHREFSMFADLKEYSWVLPTIEYRDLGDLLSSLGDKVIAPAEQKAKELETR